MVRALQICCVTTVVFVCALGVQAQDVGPGGDTCADATAIVGGETGSGTTAGAAADNDGTCGSTGAPAVFYTFVGTGNGFTVSLCGSAYDTKLSVHTGDCAALACLVSNDDSCGLQSAVTFDSVDAEVYTVRVFGYGTSAGEYTLAVNENIVPDNDLCGDAIALANGDTYSGSTAGGSAANTGDCGATGSAAVFFVVIGDGTPCVASLCGSAFDTKLSVHTGGCAALACVVDNDDSCGLQSEITWASDPGVTYYIRVFGFGTNAGDYTLSFSCGLPEGYWELDGDLTSTSGQQDLEAVGYPGVAGAPSVTYESSTIDGAAADVARISQGTALTVHHGSPSNGGGGYLNQYTLILDVNFPAIGSWISLYQTSGADPINDASNDGDWFVNPAGGIGIGGNYAGGLVADTWYRIALVVDNVAETYTSYVNGLQVQQNTGNTVDGRFSLYSTTDGAAKDFFHLFADETGGASEMGEVLLGSFCFKNTALSGGAICALGGPTAAGTTASSGPCALLANDDCPDALDLGELAENESVSVPGSTVGMTAEGLEEAQCGTSLTAQGVWYVVTASCEGGRLVGSLCSPNTDYDTKIHVFVGDCDALTCIAGNDDLGGGCATAGTHSGFDIASSAGQEYRILVSGWSGSFGNFELTVSQELCSCEPAVPNDVCDGAEALDFSEGPVVTVSGATTTACIFPDPESADCGASSAPGVWYTVTGNGGTISASTCNSADYDSKIAVFSGECDALTCVAENDDGPGCAGFTSYVEWQSTIGTEYKILLHGFNASAGSYVFTVERPTPPCVRIVSCLADNNDGSISLAWETHAVGQDGFEITANGVSVATVGPDEGSFSWTPELTPGLLNDIYVTIAPSGDSVENCAGVDSCTVWLSPGNICFADNFEGYPTDADVEIGGYFLIDENAPDENATWTISNPGGRANPPTVDGTPTSGNFMISDSDAAGGSNPPGSGMSHDIWSPSFSLEGKENAYLHVDMGAQLNNNGEAVLDIDVSTDGGGSWDNVFRRVAPARSADPLPDSTNSDGYYGRLDVDLTTAAGEADVRFRVRHFEPNDDWWIAIDNVVVDDVPGHNMFASTPGAVQFVGDPVDFNGGSANFLALSSVGNTGCQTWHTSDKGGRRNAPDEIRERGANRLSAGPIATNDFGACLSGAQQVPPVVSAATGFSQITYDPKTNIATMYVEFDVDALSSPQTAAHIHNAAAGENGGIYYELGVGSPLMDEVEATPDFLLALEQGLLYVNIHTEENPGGELRGQLGPTSGFAILESDADPDPAEDEWLLVGPYDLSGMVPGTAMITYKSETIVSGAVQDVRVSLDGGATFIDRPLFSYRGGALVDTGEEPFYAERALVVPEAAGSAEVVFAFHWASGGNAWWWGVDDIRVAGVPLITGGLQVACDFNGDGQFDMSDAVALLNHLFIGGSAPSCGGAIGDPSAIALLDANGDGAVDLSDSVWKLNYLFLGGPLPANDTGACLVLENCDDICVDAL